MLGIISPFPHPPTVACTGTTSHSLLYLRHLN